MAWRLKTADHIYGLMQLSINSGRERFCTIVDADIGFHSLTFNAFPLPGKPACDRNAESIAVSQLEVCAAKYLACSSSSYNCGNVIFLRKTRNHFCCAMCEFVGQ